MLKWLLSIDKTQTFRKTFLLKQCHLQHPERPETAMVAWEDFNCSFWKCCSVLVLLKKLLHLANRNSLCSVWVNIKTRSRGSSF